MAKSNADIQRNKRAKEKALLDRIGAEKRSLILLKALAEALQVLGERHDFEDLPRLGSKHDQRDEFSKLPGYTGDHLPFFFFALFRRFLVVFRISPAKASSGVIANCSDTPSSFTPFRRLTSVSCCSSFDFISETQRLGF
jgi:hypothetical protein